jgi:hypothetical protein
VNTLISVNLVAWWTRAPAELLEHAGSRNLVELNLHFERHRAPVQPMAEQAKAGHVGQGSTASIFDMYTLFSWVVTANICAAFGSALFSAPTRCNIAAHPRQRRSLAGFLDLKDGQVSPMH